MEEAIKFLIHPSTLAIFGHLFLVIIFGVRVVMRRPATGVALAWLFLIAVIPYGGAFAYLLVGEKRIDSGRFKRLKRFEIFVALLLPVFWRTSNFSRERRGIVRIHLSKRNKLAEGVGLTLLRYVPAKCAARMGWMFCVPQNSAVKPGFASLKGFSAQPETP